MSDNAGLDIILSAKLIAFLRLPIDAALTVLRPNNHVEAREGT